MNLPDGTSTLLTKYFLPQRTRRYTEVRVIILSSVYLCVLGGKKGKAAYFAIFRSISKNLRYSVLARTGKRY
jgi:hypothetical protein